MSENCLKIVLRSSVNLGPDFYVFFRLYTLPLDIILQCFSFRFLSCVDVELDATTVFLDCSHALISLMHYM